jgi:hypothetical protein
MEVWWEIRFKERNGRRSDAKWHISHRFEESLEAAIERANDIRADNDLVLGDIDILRIERVCIA